MIERHRGHFDVAPRLNPAASKTEPKRDRNNSDKKAGEEPGHGSTFTKSVAKSTYRLDRVRRFAQLLAQAAHVRVDCPGINQAFVTPDFIEQTIARLHPAAPQHQHAEQFEFDTR